jgi:hypothetical protein
LPRSSPAGSRPRRFAALSPERDRIVAGRVSMAIGFALYVLLYLLPGCTAD